MKTLHTKGPWRASERGGYSDFDSASRVIIGDNMRIAVVYDPGDAASHANARLIAAAPDLLEALQWYADYAGTTEINHDYGKRAQAVIAKHKLTP